MIRRRLVLGVCATVAVAIAIGSWVMVTSLESRLIDNVDRELTSGQIDPRLRDEALRGGRGNRLDRSRTALVLHDEDGTVTASSPSGTARSPDPLPDGGDDPWAGVRTVESSGDGPRYRALSISRRDGGFLVVGMSLADVDETISEARRAQVLVGVGAIAVVGILCFVFIRRAFAPIDGMIETAGRIADGDLTERTQVDDPESEVGRLGTALDGMLDRIEQAVDDTRRSEERMRRFVADASHDLRTPLTTVRGYADLYRKGATDEESVALGMERIEAEATRMSRLVDDLMLLARLDEGKPPVPAAVDMATIVGEGVDAVRVIDGDRTYDLDVTADGRDAVIHGERDRLRQVVDNLLGNIGSHTPEGTTAQVTIDTDDGELVLTVADDGPGFRPGDRDRAFDRFWRATRADENPVEGSGLGLSIVRSIVKSHGGSITLDGAPSGGARFTVRLPLAPGP